MYFSGSGDRTVPAIDPSTCWYYSDILAYPLLADKGLTSEEVLEQSVNKDRKFGRTLPEPQFVATPPPAANGSIKKRTVPVELVEEYGVDRTASVRFGFPLPAGGLFDIERMQVRNPQGRPVPHQAAATAFWPDRSLPNMAGKLA